MVDALDLVQALHDTVEQANDALARMVPDAVAKAQAEAAYQTALAATVLQLREDGMAVSIVGTVAKGDSRVVALYVAYCRAEACYDSTREELMLRKKEIDVLRETLQREWGGAR